MPHATDPVTLLLAAQGNRLLRSRERVDLAEFEQLLRVGLTGDRDGLATLRVANVHFRAWIDRLRSEHSKGILLADIHGLGLIGAPPGPLAETPMAVAQAFANVSFLQAGVLRSDELHLLAAQLIFPRPSLVTAADLFAFIDKRPEHDTLRASLLAENHEGDDWGAFVASVTEERFDAVVRAWLRALAKSPDAVKQAWLNLEASKPNPRTTASFVYRSERSVPVPPKGDVGACRASLRAALDGVRRVAESKLVVPWAQHFAGCLAMLDARPNPVHPMTKLLSILAPEAISLLTTAMASDVFGGLGTWNDVPFAKDEDYRTASDALHAQLLPSIVTAANSILE